MKGKLLAWVPLLFVWLPGPLFAQPREQPVDLNRRVFVDVNQVQPFEVLRELSPVIGSYLDSDPQLSQAPITLRVWNVRARTALDAVCEAAGCRWQLQGRTLHVTASEPPPSVPRSAEFFAKMKKPLQGPNWKFERAPLRTVADALSEAVGGQVVFEGADPSSPITVDLSSQSPFRATFAVMAALGWQERGISWGADIRFDSPIVLRLHGGPFFGPAVEPPPPARIVESDQPGLIMPRFASGAHPTYTSKAAAAGIQGTVVISCLVTKDGDTTEITVVKSLEPGLDAEAVNAARGWRFTPGKRNAKPVPVRLTLEVTFAVKK
jgi:TonB family protein